MEKAIFILLSAGAILSALFVVLPVLSKTPLHSALALVATFTCLAGLYVMLAAHAMAVMQVLVYAGAIMVLFVFVIMLLNLGERSEAERAPDTPPVIAAIVAVGLMLVVGVQIYGVLTMPSAHMPAPMLEPDFGTLKSVGETLFMDYLVPFELLGVLLTVALAGALILAKKDLRLPQQPVELTGHGHDEESL
jgi:NADH-quinone oxidoreductase subunit J